MTDRPEAKIRNFTIHRLLEYNEENGKERYYSLPNDGQDRPLFTIGPSQEYLSKLDKIPKIHVMIVIPGSDAGLMVG